MDSGILAVDHGIIPDADNPATDADNLATDANNPALHLTLVKPISVTHYTPHLFVNQTTSQSYPTLSAKAATEFITVGLLVD